MKIHLRSLFSVQLKRAPDIFTDSNLLSKKASVFIKVLEVVSERPECSSTLYTSHPMVTGHLTQTVFRTTNYSENPIKASVGWQHSISEVNIRFVWTVGWNFLIRIIRWFVFCDCHLWFKVNVVLRKTSWQIQNVSWREEVVLAEDVVTFLSRIYFSLIDWISVAILLS